jgi:hypothetical protein
VRQITSGLKKWRQTLALALGKGVMPCRSHAKLTDVILHRVIVLYLFINLS